MFLDFLTFVPIQTTFFKAKKSGVTPDNRVTLDMYPFASPNVRQITFLFTLYYPSDESFVNCLAVIIFKISLSIHFQLA